MDCEARSSPQNPEGRYANYFTIGYNAHEVIFDFGQFYEGSSQPQMHTRVVTNPVYAKALLSLLRSSLAKYEDAFGPIPSGETDE